MKHFLRKKLTKFLKQQVQQQLRYDVHDDDAEKLFPAADRKQQGDPQFYGKRQREPEQERRQLCAPGKASLNPQLFSDAVFQINPEAGVKRVAMQDVADSEATSLRIIQQELKGVRRVVAPAQSL